MLTSISKREVKSTKLIKAPIVVKAKTVLGERAFNSMVRRMSEYVEAKGHKAKEYGESSYHIFAIALGDNGDMPKADYDYLWRKAEEVFGGIDEVKRFLGTLQMYCFSASSFHWIYIEDPEKKLKLESGDIPDATQYFLHREPAPRKATFDDLAAKFNRS